jgi:hypothetical protein
MPARGCDGSSLPTARPGSGRQKAGQRAHQVLAHGMDPIAAGAAGRWFTPGFRARAPASVDGLVGQLQACDPRGYAACCAFVPASSLGALDRPTIWGQFSQGWAPHPHMNP